MEGFPVVHDPASIKKNVLVYLFLARNLNFSHYKSMKLK